MEGATHRVRTIESVVLKGFRDFLMRGNVIDLAVAVVIGAAFGAVVSAFANDFIGRLIGIVGGSPDFANAGVTINGSKVVYGSTITALIQFAIVAGAIYFAVVAAAYSALTAGSGGTLPSRPT